MSEHSPIEWTDHTFNPWWGCSKVSPGCDNCYAERDAKRFAPGRVLWGLRRDGAERRTFGDAHWTEPVRWNAKARRAGVRQRVFCASMADVFDKDGDSVARTRLWYTIRGTEQLDWLILTKRVGNVASMLPEEWMREGFPPNFWLGISVVDQAEADRDIPKLIALPARVRFLSCEPLLGPLHLRRFLDWPEDGHMHEQVALDWVIAGGESGPKARPSHPDWFRGLRDQCAAAGVPFLFKQWGEWAEAEARGASPSAVPGNLCRVQTPGLPDHYVAIDYDGALATTLVKVGKKDAGRLLDGVQHDGFPAP